MTTQQEPLYAIVDCAQDPQLYGLVQACAEHICLFFGKVAEPLNRAAPYLVRLQTQEALYRAWTDEGSGRNWGIFMHSALSLDELARHFRHFLQARLPDGMVVQFRFYDPRVFNTYIATCTADELASWFAGVSSFLVERQGEIGYHQYALRGGLLHDGPNPVAMLTAENA